jgi:hypothetical protein
VETKGKKTVWRIKCAAHEYAEEKMATRKKSEPPLEVPVDQKPNILTDDQSSPSLYTLPSTCGKYLPDAIAIALSQNPEQPTQTDSTTANDNLTQLITATEDTQESETKELIDPSNICSENFRKLLPICGSMGSRFCSDVCGFSLAKHHLLSSISTKCLPKQKSRKLTEEEKRYQPAKATPWVSEVADLSHFRQLKKDIHFMKVRIRALEKWQREVDDAIERAWKMLVPTSVLEGSSASPQSPVRGVAPKLPKDADQDENGGLESNAPNKSSIEVSKCKALGRICGFDRRLVTEWVVPNWKEWLQQQRKALNSQNGELVDSQTIDAEASMKSANETDSGQRALNGAGNDEDGVEPLNTMCMAVGKCDFHHDWQELRAHEVELEIELQVNK